MLALKTGLESAEKLGAVLGFCGLNLSFEDKHKDLLPLFVGVSKNDSVVPYGRALDSFEPLETCRKDYNYCLYTD